jgi:glutathione S-transferase
MSEYNLNNPVFVSYLIAASLMILKMMMQGWITVFRMIRSDAGLLNTEDLLPGPANRNPRPEQLGLNDYVERSRRIHRNDLENILPFLACGLLYVATGPSAVLANIMFFVFVGVRLAHTAAYITGQRHELRATFFSVGSIVVMVMAVQVLLVALGRL